MDFGDRVVEPELTNEGSDVSRPPERSEALADIPLARIARKEIPI